jgi:hypothetical protein
MALLPLSPITIALLLCNLASPLDALPPLHMLAGCQIGQVVVASSLVMPPPLKAPSHCPRCFLMHSLLVCPGWLSHHLAAATTSHCAGLLLPCLSLQYPLVCPAQLSHHPSSCHRLSTHCCCNLSRPARVGVGADTRGVGEVRTPLPAPMTTR